MPDNISSLRDKIYNLYETSHKVENAHIKRTLASLDEMQLEMLEFLHVDSPFTYCTNNIYQMKNISLTADLVKLFKMLFYKEQNIAGLEELCDLGITIQPSHLTVFELLPEKDRRVSSVKKMRWIAPEAVESYKALPKAAHGIKAFSNVLKNRIRLVHVRALEVLPRPDDMSISNRLNQIANTFTNLTFCHVEALKVLPCSNHNFEVLMKIQKVSSECKISHVIQQRFFNAFAMLPEAERQYEGFMYLYSQIQHSDCQFQVFKKFPVAERTYWNLLRIIYEIKSYHASALKVLPQTGSMVQYLDAFKAMESLNSYHVEALKVLEEEPTVELLSKIVEISAIADMHGNGCMFDGFGRSLGQSKIKSWHVKALKALVAEEHKIEYKIGCLIYLLRMGDLTSYHVEALKALWQKPTLQNLVDLVEMPGLHSYHVEALKALWQKPMRQNLVDLVGMPGLHSYHVEALKSLTKEEPTMTDLRDIIAVPGFTSDCISHFRKLSYRFFYLQWQEICGGNFTIDSLKIAVVAFRFDIPFSYLDVIPFLMEKDLPFSNGNVKNLASVLISLAKGSVAQMKLLVTDLLKSCPGQYGVLNYSLNDSDSSPEVACMFEVIIKDRLKRVSQEQSDKAIPGISTKVFNYIREMVDKYDKADEVIARICTPKFIALVCRTKDEYPYYKDSQALKFIKESSKALQVEVRPENRLGADDAEDDVGSESEVETVGAQLDEGQEEDALASHAAPEATPEGNRFSLSSDNVTKAEKFKRLAGDATDRGCVVANALSASASQAAPEATPEDSTQARGAQAKKLVSNTFRAEFDAGWISDDEVPPAPVQTVTQMRQEVAPAAVPQRSKTESKSSVLSKPQEEDGMLDDGEDDEGNEVTTYTDGDGPGAPDDSGVAITDSESGQVNSASGPSIAETLFMRNDISHELNVSMQQTDIVFTPRETKAQAAHSYAISHIDHSDAAARVEQVSYQDKYSVNATNSVIDPSSGVGVLEKPEALEGDLLGVGMISFGSVIG